MLIRNMVVKINEPKTPFHYEVSEEADEAEVPLQLKV